MGMKVLFVAAEVAPFVSVGGLSQVVYYLPQALTKLGHDVRVFTPKYGTIDASVKEGDKRKKWPLSMEYEGLKVPLEHVSQGQKERKKENLSYLICNVKSYRGKKSLPSAYFLENREYYELRANVFGYNDDHTRFALLSKGVLEWLLKKDKSWFPDVIHCNDWHSCYLIELAKRDQRYQKLLSKTPVVLTVHNFFFQGNFDFRFASADDKDDGANPLEPLLSPKLQKQNALLRGIRFADAITTVSPTHAIEVLTPEYAHGLEEELVKARGKLIGILNGLDTKEFNPAKDPNIKKQYNERTFITGRRENKLDLQKTFALEQNEQKTLLAISGRLSQQKGWDLLLEVLPHLLTHRKDVQMIVVGGGDDIYRNRLVLLQKEYQEQLALHLQADFRLPRKLFAGADMILIPSIFEPGGIVALEALRYGAVPIVRRTGGLNDIIEDFNPENRRGNGFSFTEKDPWALYGAVIEALTVYRQPVLWQRLVRNAMSDDFSWEHAAADYDGWYRQVSEQYKRAANIITQPAYE